jgi:hypothetical protein
MDPASDKFKATKLEMGLVLSVRLEIVVRGRKNEILLGVAIWVVVLWGVRPRWSMDDRTSDENFLCPKHIHVYQYCPGDSKNDACYVCPCGKTEAAREQTESG